MSVNCLRSWQWRALVKIVSILWKENWFPGTKIPETLYKNHQSREPLFLAPKWGWGKTTCYKGNFLRTWIRVSEIQTQSTYWGSKWLSVLLWDSAYKSIWLQGPSSLRNLGPGNLGLYNNWWEYRLLHFSWPSWAQIYHQLCSLFADPVCFWGTRSKGSSKKCSTSGKEWGVRGEKKKQEEETEDLLVSCL